MASGKEIGRAVNQILGGIGSLVAGAYLGPAGASGVQAAAGGVDKLLAAVIPEEQSEPSAEAGKTPAAGSGPVKPKTGTEIVRVSIPKPGESRDAREVKEDTVGNALQAEQILRGLGWDPAEILAALRGPKAGREVLAGAAHRESKGEEITVKKSRS